MAHLDLRRQLRRRIGRIRVFQPVAIVILDLIGMRRVETKRVDAAPLDERGELRALTQECRSGTPAFHLILNERFMTGSRIAEKHRFPRIGCLIFAT